VSSIQQELQSIADRIERLAERYNTSGHTRPLVSDVMASLFPPATLHASQAKGGKWWAYLVMPDGWRPRQTDDHRWIYNSYNDHYWTDTSGDTEREAIVKAIQQLLTAS
jgi:hypothetical protein